MIVHTCSRICMLLLAALFLTACVERKERIIIDEAGVVEIVIDWSAQERDDLTMLDVAPNLEAGWLVEEHESVAADGKTGWTLRAEARFPSGVTLPENFAPPFDVDKERYLQFPTEVMIEQRDGCTYYHFRRAYEGREHAFFSAELERAGNELTKRLNGRRASEIEPAEQPALMHLSLQQVIAMFEPFAERAHADVAPDAPQDVWLQMRRAMHGVIEARISFVTDLLLAGGSPEENGLAQEDVKRQCEELEKELFAAMRDAAFASGHYGGNRWNTFQQRFDRHRQMHQISQEIWTDTFTVELVLPGELVGHNGESTAHDAGTTTITWRFTGDVLQDRDKMLMATTRICGRKR